MSVGVGIVGTGMIANFHAKAIADAGNAHLVGCFNRSIEKAQAFADQHGGKAFSSLEEMIAEEKEQAKGRARVARDSIDTTELREMEAERSALEEMALADFAAEAGIVIEGKDGGGASEGAAVEDEKAM